MIVASAKAAGATEFYSHDQKCRNLAGLVMTARDLPTGDKTLEGTCSYLATFGKAKPSLRTQAIPNGQLSGQQHRSRRFYFCAVSMRVAQGAAAAVHQRAVLDLKTALLDRRAEAGQAIGRGRQVDLHHDALDAPARPAARCGRSRIRPLPRGTSTARRRTRSRSKRSARLMVGTSSQPAACQGATLAAEMECAGPRCCCRSNECGPSAPIGR